MPTRSSEFVPLSPGQAQYVLERLVREGRIRRTEVSQYLAGLPREIAELEARLYKLRGAASDGAAEQTASAPVVQQRTRPPARTRKTTAKGLAAKQLGGRFAGLIRRLPEAERAQYHEIKSTKGVEAAIRALQNRRK